MATLLEAIRSERSGVALKDGPTSRIRMAFLAGERLGRADLERLGAASTSMIHVAMGDLKRVGYKFDSEQIAPPRRGGLPTVVHWVTNPRHIPKIDSGPTRKYHPRKPKTVTPEPTVRSTPVRESKAMKVYPLGLTFTLIGVDLADDGTVRYRLTDWNGRTIVDGVHLDSR